jgi:hypothetical protein
VRADGKVCGRDKFIIVRSFEVHIEDTTTPDTVHVGAEKYRHVFELAWFDSVASVL